ncbi:MAG: glycosyltransferase family 39 protein [Myxococcota bacterium]
MRLIGSFTNGRFSARMGRLQTYLEQRGEWWWCLVIVALGLLIYLPFLGAYPLWDPWEPHYTQVAWEMQERGTWLNPWYRGRDNWWSKPILMLWMLRANLALFWDPATNFADNELIARLPFALTAIFGGVMQYHWVRLLFGRRVAVMAAVILLTAPQYLLIGRQVMVDTPFVATYAASMGYLAVGLFTQRTGNVGSLSGWFQREWPFVAFWALQAVALLAKGFVPCTLAVLVMVGYWIVTFRWRDYRESLGDVRWRSYFLRRGVWTILVVAGVALATWAIMRLSGMPQPARLLYSTLIAVTGSLILFLGVLHDLPPSQHAWRLLKRMRAGWGLVLFFLLGAPWYIYMSFKHGWPYWSEFIFYHHLGRAAGTIDKPSNTFDFYLLQVGVGLFPWSAFLPAALWKFSGRASPMRSVAERRNAFVLLCAVLPYLFFTLSGTKFSHYIFPVIPFLGVMIAATLLWLGKDTPSIEHLAEDGPALGPRVEDPQPRGDDLVPWWRRVGARGDMTIFAALAIVSFSIIAHDLAMNFRLFLRLFIYYQSRATPVGYHPFVALQVIFITLGIAIGTLLWTRYIGAWQRALWSLGAIVTACYIGWVTMPAMAATYSLKPLYEAYQAMAKPGEEIGEFNDWQQPVRSVIFLFQNRAHHLNSSKVTKAFLKRPGRKFVLVDRYKLPELRKLAREVDVKLYVVADQHPYERMVSDVANPNDARKAAEHILKTPPSDMQPLGALFEDKIELLGWRPVTTAVQPGASIELHFFYRCLTYLDKDWQIFAHGDEPGGRSHRLHADHYPLDGLYPTTEWQPGEIIEDVFKIDVPADYPFKFFYVWTGWYAGNTRMELKNQVPNDGDNRVRGPQIRVAE